MQGGTIEIVLGETSVNECGFAFKSALLIPLILWASYLLGRAVKDSGGQVAVPVCMLTVWQGPPTRPGHVSVQVRDSGRDRRGAGAGPPGFSFIGALRRKFFDRTPSYF